MVRKLALMCHNYKKYNCIENCPNIDITDSFMNTNNKKQNRTKIK